MIVNNGFGGGKRRCNSKQARHYPFDIAIDRHGAAPERNGGNSGGRVAADPRQLREQMVFVGKLSVMLLDHNPRTSMQIARASVITKPRPSFENVVKRGPRQRTH